MCNVPAPHPIANPEISYLLHGLTHALAAFCNAREGRSSKNRLDMTALLGLESGGSSVPTPGRKGKLGLDMKIPLPYINYTVTVQSCHTPVKYEIIAHG